MIRDVLWRRKTSDSPAVLGGERTVSYRELARRAAGLQKLLPSEHAPAIAAVLISDGADFLAALFAVLQAGWIAFPINDRLRAEEIADLLRQAPVRLIFTSEALLSLCQEAVRTLPEQPAILCADALPFLLPPLDPLPGMGRSAPGMDRSAPDVGRPGQSTPGMDCSVPDVGRSVPGISCTAPDSPMLLLASSGTTGRVKLVQLSENNLDFSVRTYLNHMGYELYRDPAPRYALGTPLFGIYGLMMAFACILKGFPMLPMAQDFTVDTLYRAAQDLGISHYDGGILAAILMDRMLGRPIPYDISSLRYFGFGGSKAPDGTLERLSLAFPKIRFWSGYGMTEASPLIAQPFKKLPFDKLGSVGVPLPGAEVLLETAQGRTSRPHQPGEIVTRGPHVMLGYYENEEATDEILRGGWLHTGDVGYFDDDGYLYICGRIKHMILVRGFNVYPEEVETRLLGCPLIEDCLVYGRESDAGGEMVCADVVPSGPETTPDAIHSWCTAHLADYKRPAAIRLVKSLDRTSTGKIKRAREE